jgi:hypothetical protein
MDMMNVDCTNMVEEHNHLTGGGGYEYAEGAQTPDESPAGGGGYRYGGYPYGGGERIWIW